MRAVACTAPLECSPDIIVVSSTAHSTNSHPSLLTAHFLFMESIYLHGPHGRIHTYRFGAGPELLIAIHGFSDRARMFTVLEPALAGKYTVVAIDLPFHGQTEWQKNTFCKLTLF